MPSRDRIVDIEARFVRETELARCFDFGLDDNVWLPKSQHEWDESDNTVSLPERVANEKGLI